MHGNAKPRLRMLFSCYCSCWLKLCCGLLTCWGVPNRSQGPLTLMNETQMTTVKRNINTLYINLKGVCHYSCLVNNVENVSHLKVDVWRCNIDLLSSESKFRCIVLSVLRQSRYVIYCRMLHENKVDNL